MKSFQAIGWQKVVRFVLYGIYQAVLTRVLLPPVRAWMLRLAGARVGNNCVIHNVHFDNLYHYGFAKIIIGNNCFIGDEVLLDARGGVTLGDHVTLSNRVAVLTHINVGYPDHPLQKAYPMRESAVVMKRGVYIGTGATILPGVAIGQSSVVGAGAVVTRDVPARTVVAGVPAKVIKKIQK
jgi:acetyltransferase-like isoleucine patch superfamily enzyme